MSTETLAEVNESTEAVTPELGAYMTKEPTHLHHGYADYLKDKVGYGPDKNDTQAWGDFVKTIQLAVVLYGRYQKSEENEARKVREREEKEAAAEAAKAEKAAAAEAKKAEKAKADASKAAEKEAEGTDDVKVARKPGGKAVKPKVAAAVSEAPF